MTRSAARISCAPVLLESGQHLERRLKSIADERRPRAALSRKARLVLLVAALLALPGVALTARSATAPAAPAVIEIKDINAKVAQLNLETATRADVTALFGKPASYIWGNQTFAEDKLPNFYIMFYSRVFSVFMSMGQIQELRFEDRSDYAFHGTLRVGSTLDEALKVMGPSDRTVEGGTIGFEDGVLYKDAQIRENGENGVSYYARRDKGIRIFAVHNVLTALYLTRRTNETAQPTSSEYWSVLIILDFPNLHPPAVQFAIFERDPVPAFRNQVSRKRDLYLQLLAQGKSEFGNARAKGGQMEVSWDFGFRDTPGNEVYLLTSGSRKLMGSNSPAGKRWVVTKAVTSGDRVLCWSIPFEADPHRSAVITLTEKNALDISPIYDEAMSHEANPPVQPTSPAPSAAMVMHGMLGVVVQNVTPDLAKALGLSEDKGALVAVVYKDFPADKAGVKTGDVIVRYDGRAVENAARLHDIVAATAPDTEVKLGIIRNGKEETLTARVGKPVQVIDVGPTTNER